MYTVGLKKRDFKRCMCTCGTLHCHFWVCFYILQYIPTGNFSRLSYVIHVYLLKLMYLYFIYGLPLLNWCFPTIFWRYSSIQPTIVIASPPPPPQPPSCHTTLFLSPTNSSVLAEKWGLRQRSRNMRMCKRNPVSQVMSHPVYLRHSTKQAQGKSLQKC